MSTSDTEQKWRAGPLFRAAVTHLILAVLAVAVNWFYGLFSHGVRSAAMTWMFLYPLIGGTMIFALLDAALPRQRRIPCFRLCFNLHNSGIAAMTAAAFLQGIVEIAGTASPYTAGLYGAGWAFSGAGVALFLLRAPPKIRVGRQ